MSEKIIAAAEAEIGAVRYATTIQTGEHTVIGDEPVSAGGADAGPSPFGLVLSGLGACTAITLKMYAERKEWPLESARVEMTYYKDGDARHIRRELSFKGALDAEQVARMADIAERTPVTLALKQGFAIATSVKA